MMAAAALLVTGNLPSEVYKPDDEEEDDDEVAEAAPT
jgi:hypothetical protein